jgi:predicted MFS family arabinose efflux permease
MMTYKNRLLLVLALILAFNGVDRLAMALVLQEIKVDLALSDTQLGFLTGIAFAAFYALVGLQIARWADRGNRIAIISVTTALASIMMALCAVAGTYRQLLLVRIGVAVGEAGCMPPSHSLIAEHFSRAERPRALARYMLGWSLSIVVGFFGAGWLNEAYGWRRTFIWIGLPGLLLAIAARVFLRAPRLADRVTGVAAPLSTAAVFATDERAPTDQNLSFRQVASTLLANGTFCHLLFCISLTYLFANGLTLWQPAFFIRSYGLKTGELGTWLAVIFGVGGFLGTYLGGEWASRCAAGNERKQLQAAALVFCSFGFISALTYLSPNKFCALGLLGLGQLSISASNGPLYATIQTLVPEQMRAVSIAIVLFFANLIGMGLGPLAAGALSDAFRPYFGEESLRYALMALSPGYLWCAWHLWRASRTVTGALSAAS